MSCLKAIEHIHSPIRGNFSVLPLTRIVVRPTIQSKRAGTVLSQRVILPYLRRYMTYLAKGLESFKIREEILCDPITSLVQVG